MRDGVITAVMIAAALLYLFAVFAVSSQQMEYKDVYEQMRAEQMIM